MKRKLRIVVDGNGKFKVQCSYFFGLFWEDVGHRPDPWSWVPDLYDSLAEAKARMQKMRELLERERNAKTLIEVVGPDAELIAFHNARSREQVSLTGWKAEVRK